MNKNTPSAAQIASGFLSYIESIGATSQLPEIISQLRLKSASKDNDIRVASASELTPSQKLEITEWVTKHLGDFPIYFQVDPQLIGGFCVYQGDKQIDLSIAKKLKNAYA